MLGEGEREERENLLENGERELIFEGVAPFLVGEGGGEEGEEGGGEGEGEEEWKEWRERFEKWEKKRLKI